MKRKFILIVTENDDGYSFRSKSNGFDAMQIMGILAAKMEDIRDQMKGLVQPKIKEIERTLVKEKQKTKEQK